MDTEDKSSVGVGGGGGGGKRIKLPSSASSQSSSSKTKLPNQLAALIQGEAGLLQEEGFLPGGIAEPSDPDGAANAAHHRQPNINEIVTAAQSRSVKELSSYTRSMCMRLGFDS